MRISYLLLVFLFALSVTACDDDGKKNQNNVNNTNNVNNINNANNVNNGYCGDGRILGDEECDDGNFTSNDGCSSTCRWEYECGDGLREFSEECDGADFGEATCVTWGHAGGALACNADCTIDDTACVDPAERLRGG